VEMKLFAAHWTQDSFERTQQAKGLSVVPY
jgi:hypothetical protein